MDTLTLNEHAYIIILACFWCIFCALGFALEAKAKVAIIAGDSVKIRRFNRWGK